MEHLYYEAKEQAEAEELAAEVAALIATPEGRSEFAKREAGITEWHAREAGRREKEAQQERDKFRRWAEHPSWGAWLSVKGVLEGRFMAGGLVGKQYDFGDFVDEYGPQPSPGHDFGVIDSAKPIAPSNLGWRPVELPKASPAPSPYLTLAEAAAYCRCSPKTLSNRVWQGKLRPLPKSKPQVFKREELDRYIASGGKKLPRTGA